MNEGLEPPGDDDLLGSMRMRGCRVPSRDNQQSSAESNLPSVTEEAHEIAGLLFGAAEIIRRRCATGSR
ncbi:MAG: hypothetical protein M3203_10830 [Actinomycetota bacterium]|nr:hypothetical protein [Actinomycetota bacterium]